MEHKREQENREREFNKLFLNLDEQNQNYILGILHSLQFAQSVVGVGEERNEYAGNTV